MGSCGVPTGEVERRSKVDITHQTGVWSEAIEWHVVSNTEEEREEEERRGRCFSPVSVHVNTSSWELLVKLVILVMWQKHPCSSSGSIQVEHPASVEIRGWQDHGRKVLLGTPQGHPTGPALGSPQGQTKGPKHGKGRVTGGGSGCWAPARSTFWRLLSHPGPDSLGLRGVGGWQVHSQHEAALLQVQERWGLGWKAVARSG